MDCLRSFNFTIRNQSNWPVALGFYTWTIGGQRFWNLDRSNPNGSTYVIQGFKNINIFKIEVTGDLNSSPQFPPYVCLVQNWFTDLEIDGQNSTSVGSILVSPDIFGMTIQPKPFIRLSKYQNSITFETPIESAKSIKLTNIYADGIANEDIGSAEVGIVLNFSVFYKYEGE
jgi:hypothetical protein